MHTQILLNQYRDKHLCFNDDIQGTGATTLAGLLGALRAQHKDVTALGDQRIVIVGAGSAGIGVAEALKQAMVVQGRTEEEARKCFYILDQEGYVPDIRNSNLLLRGCVDTSYSCFWRRALLLFSDALEAKNDPDTPFSHVYSVHHYCIRIPHVSGLSFVYLCLFLSITHFHVHGGLSFTVSLARNVSTH